MVMTLKSICRERFVGRRATKKTLDLDFLGLASSLVESTLLVAPLTASLSETDPFLSNLTEGEADACCSFVGYGTHGEGVMKWL